MMAYEIPDQTGKRFVITGANSGTGKEAARRLAAANAEIIMAVRTPEKGDSAKAEILAQYPSAKLHVEKLDIASLDSISNFADRLKQKGKKIDVLLNNAGVMAPPERELTRDGFELQIGTNFLGPFALTHHLLPLLFKSPAPRVTTMASFGSLFAPPVGQTRFNDLQAQRHYAPFPVYARSKLADLVLARELARIARHRGWNLISNAAHPGITHTNLTTSGPNIRTNTQKEPLLYRLIWLFAMDVKTGAVPLLQAATDPKAKAGSYYGPMFMTNGSSRRACPPYSTYWIEKNGDSRKLWEEAERLTGLKFT